MKSVYSIIKYPTITEKATTLASNQNQYVFEVATTANKKEIKDAVEKCFNVKVKSVNTMNVIGKMKRVRYKAGRTAAKKKAIVTLQKDNKIDYTS
jgi:large subunit ribosomal protein L23